MANDFSGASGLVMHATFTGSDPFSDKSGNGNDLIVQGGIVLDKVNMRYGTGCADFDKNKSPDGLLLLDSSLSANFPCKSGTSNPTFSVCFWFKVRSFYDYGVIVGKYEYWTNKRCWAAATTSAKILALWWGYNSGNSVATLNSSRTLEEGVWYFAKMVWDDPGNTASIYLYDTSNSTWYKDSASMTNALNCEDEPFRIGRSGASGRYFDGLIQDVCIYLDVVSDAEAQSMVAGTYDYDADSNLLSRYKLDASGLCIDAKGNNHLQGGGLPDQDGPRADIKTALFDGARLGSVWRPDNQLSSNFPGKYGTANNVVSVAFWVKFRAWTASEWTRMVAKWTRTAVTNSPWAISASDASGNREFFASWENGYEVHSGVNALLDRWYHVGAVLDDASNATYIRIYDATADTVTEQTGNPGSAAMPMTAAAFHVGSGMGGISVPIDYPHATAYQSFDGWIGEVVVFNRVLTRDEFEAIQAGSYGPAAKATDPSPADDATDVVIDVTCWWTDGGGATSFDVYWGTTSGSLTRVSAGQAGTSYDPPTDLEYGQTYYWRIDSINGMGTTSGDEWSFTTAAAPVTETEPYLIPFPATLPFRETLSFLTGIVKSADGSEQRIAHRGGIPRQGFVYPLLCGTEDQSVRLTHMLHTWLKRQLAIPIWAEAEVRTASLAAGATSIAFDTRYADYRVGSRALVYQDPHHAELVTISAVATDGLTIDPGLAGDYNGVHLVMPCRVGYAVGSAQRERFACGASIVELSLEVTDNSAITGWTAGLTYDGYDVLTDPAWLSGETFRESHDSDAVVIDAGVGTFKIASTSEFNIGAQDHGFVNDTKAQAWSFRQWLHAVVGRQKAFLVPTFRPDFTLTRACGASDTSIYVRNLGRAAYLGVNNLRTYLAFRPAAATIIPRKIVGMAPIDNAEERIDLNTAPGQAFAPGAELCWVDRCRLASDTIELEWYQRGRNLCQTQLVRVQQ